MRQPPSKNTKSKNKTKIFALVNFFSSERNHNQDTRNVQEGSPGASIHSNLGGHGLRGEIISIILDTLRKVIQNQNDIMREQTKLSDRLYEYEQKKANRPNKVQTNE